MFQGDSELVAALEEAYRALQEELTKITEEKTLIFAEDRIRAEIQAKLQAMQTQVTEPVHFEKQGDERV